MSRLQLFILWLLAIGAGFYFFNSQKKNQEAGEQTKLQTGDLLLPAGVVESIDSLVITKGADNTTLKKGNESWGVTEKGNFEANISNVSNILVALREAKVAQGIPVASEYFNRFNLDPNDEDADNRPQIVTLSEGDKKTILYVGKNRSSTGGQGGSSGRFVRLDSDPSGVYVVSESFFSLNSDPSSWLDKTLKPLEAGTIKIEATAPTDKDFKPWSVSRETVRDDFLVSDLTETEETNTSLTTQLKNFLERTTFSDIVTE